MISLTVSVALAAALLLSWWIDVWLISRQVRHVSRHRAAVPPAFEGALSLPAHQRAADYTVARQRWALYSTTWGSLLLLGWTLLGGLDALNFWVRETVQPRAGDLAYQVALVLAVGFLGSLLDLPLEAWRIFRLEQSHGFNRMTPGLWIRDQLMGAGVGLVIGIPVAALLIWLMGAAGSLWWLWAFAAVAGFSVLMQVLYPTFIAPLFNRFQPLDNEGLRLRVEGLMQRCGFQSRGLFVMDGSKRSAHANAYFTGFGAGKRVVFFDTLLTRLTPGEVEAVLAHELGHFHHRHVIKRMVMMMGIWLVSLALLGWLMKQPWFYTGLGVQPNLIGPNHGLALVLLMMVGPVFGGLLAPLAMGLSRRHEYEADAYACTHARGEDLESALLKLHEDNASTLTPDPLYARMKHSHPPAVERLAAIAALAGQRPRTEGT